MNLGNIRFILINNKNIIEYYNGNLHVTNNIDMTYDICHFIADSERFFSFFLHTEDSAYVTLSGFPLVKPVAYLPLD